MTDKEIIRMAREAGLSEPFPKSEQVKRFAFLVAQAEREAIREQGWRQCAVGQKTTQYCAATEYAIAAEREACAKVAEQYKEDCYDGDAQWCAAHAIFVAIKSRGEV